MISVRRKLFAIAALGLLSALPVRAAEPVPSTPSAIDKRLAAYDPRAVAAARHYYSTPALRSALVAMVDSVNKSMLGLVSQQNPGIAPDQLVKVQKIVGDAMKERLDLLQQMSMVVALDTFSTDELVALDKFYSSPEGASVLGKMPKLAAQMPAMMQAIIPDYLNDVKTKLKASGTELKL
jgi:hypothetical protein